MKSVVWIVPSLFFVAFAGCLEAETTLAPPPTESSPVLQQGAETISLRSSRGEFDAQWWVNETRGANATNYVVLILVMCGDTVEAWEGVAQTEYALGRAVLIVDHQATDVQARGEAALKWLKTTYDSTAIQKIALIGASCGADRGIVIAGQEPLIWGAALLSSNRVDDGDAVVNLRKPLFMSAAPGDTASYLSYQYHRARASGPVTAIDGEGAAHGSELLSQPAVLSALLNWLST